MKTLLYHDVDIVRHYKTATEIMDKIHSMYGREGFQYSKIVEEPHYILQEKENEGSTFLAVVDPTFSQGYSDSSLESNAMPIIDLKGRNDEVI